MSIWHKTRQAYCLTYANGVMKYLMRRPSFVIASDRRERGNPVLLLETWGPAYADSSFGKAGWIATSPRFREGPRDDVVGVFIGLFDLTDVGGLDSGFRRSDGYFDGEVNYDTFGYSGGGLD